MSEPIRKIEQTPESYSPKKMPEILSMAEENMRQSHIQNKDNSYKLKDGTIINDTDLLKYVDNGANLYVRILGQASHMAIEDNGIYEYIHPKNNEDGLRFVYNIRLDNLIDVEKERALADISKFKAPTWYPLLPSNEYTKDDEELYGAMLYDWLPKYIETSKCIEIKRVTTRNEFNEWCRLCNDYMHGGSNIIDPKSHWEFVENGTIAFYLGYADKKAVSVCAVIYDDKICSLEFAYTLSDYREKGYCKALSQYALNEAFENGAEIVTIRTINNGHYVGKSLGFRFYVNHRFILL